MGIKALILTSQRTGSFFLEQCLNSHPSVRCYGEVLIGFDGIDKVQVPKIITRNRKVWILWTYILSGVGLTPRRVIQKLYSHQAVGVTAFRAMYTHLKDPRVKNFFHRDTSIRIIHLKRENLLAQYVSRQLMHHQRKLGRSEAHTTKALPSVSMEIAVDDAIRGMTNIEQQQQQYSDLFSGHKNIELVYETMIDEKGLTDAASRKLFDLFNIEPHPMTSPLVKLNPRELHLMVDNYEVLKVGLTGTRFERFLV